MFEALVDLSWALRTKGLWNKAIDLSMPLVRVGIGSGFLSLENLEIGFDNPFWWMFPDNFEELPLERRISLEGMQMELFIGFNLLLGRDLIAEQNPGRSQGFIEYIRLVGAQLPISADEGRSSYREKRVREFFDATQGYDREGKRFKRLLDEFEALPQDLSDPAGDETIERLIERTVSRRAKRGRAMVQEHTKRHEEIKV
jgi:hypothetical protein